MTAERDPIRLLTYSTLYPSVARPQHGIFVEQRLRHLVATGEAVSRVVAPVPWFPSSDQRFGRFSSFAKTPPSEDRHGLVVNHPRYASIPKIGMTARPMLLAAGSRANIRQILDDGYEFDLIDAHYLYPDGIAAAMLAREFNKPLLITARGSDVSQISAYRLPRKMIRWAADKAAGLITVCNALKRSLVDLGIPEDRLHVLRNGVDLDLFRPIDREAARRHIGLEPDGRILVSAGLLIDRKGHDIIIRALRDLPDVRLLVAGDGERDQALKKLARETGVADRVEFLGAVPHQELRWYFSAADALVLASSREGWANVLLEAMACGTPVIASNVWGTPEVVASEAAGILMNERSPEGIVDAYQRLFERYPDRSATREYAECFSWDDTSRGQLALMRAAINGAGRPS